MNIEELLMITINEDLINMIISNRRKNTIEFTKHKIRPVDFNNNIRFQVESFTNTQAFHKNYLKEHMIQYLMEIMENNHYKQIDIYTKEKDYHVLINKKGKLNIKIKDSIKEQKELAHNKTKKYILEEGSKIHFLVDLGVMTNEGKIVAKKYDKFKQINRYLEIVEDILPKLDKNKEISIIDFGCGKSYLTFALYYYLVNLKKYEINVTGLDLKEEVINNCNKLASKYNFQNLSFKVGDIANYSIDNKVDMVITLHACDTATDAAIKKAIKWDADVILSVPCCQHELNSQIKCEELQDILQYGIIKERMAALITDAMRANWLKLEGYNVQILEFIDTKHTPKNLLIRGVKTNKKVNKQEELNKFNELEQFLNSNLSIKN
jgi:SAM-dependent methyltransferase